MKPLLAKLHKYVALTVGVLVAMMGLTGALIVFKDELDDHFHPERRVAPPADARPAFESVLRTARQAVPEADGYVIDILADPTRAFNVNVEEPGRRLFIDPYSGKLITNTAEDELTLDWVVQLHTQLMGGEVGKYLVAGVGGVLVFLAVTGVILWWPRKWKNALRVRWSAARLGLNYDLHKSAGAIFALFFLVNAVTGITLVFSSPAARLVGTLAGNLPPAVPKLPPHAPGSQRLSLDQLVSAAAQALPEARVTRVVVPAREAPVLVRSQIAGEHHPNGVNRVYVDPYDGKVLGVVRRAQGSPGMKMFDWLYPLHIGQLFGTAHQVFQVILGLVPAFLLTTGLIVWVTARQARKLNASRAALAGATSKGPPEGAGRVQVPGK